MNEKADNSKQNNLSTTIHAPRPSSPRKFFARLYGHLEEAKCSDEVVQELASGSSSEVDVEERREELVSPAWRPSVLPLCPPPMMLAVNRFYHYNSYMVRRRNKESRPRRQRTTFSAHQTLRLELEYAKNEYVVKAVRCKLATELSLSENQVKIWFQNRRAKDKRIEKAQMDQRYRQLAAASGLLPTTMFTPYPAITSPYPQLSPPYPYLQVPHPPTMDK